MTDRDSRIFKPHAGLLAAFSGKCRLWLKTPAGDRPLFSDRAFLGLLLLGAGLAAALLQPRYDVGFINDDASFVLLGKLLRDRLLALSGSDLGTTFGHFMPGYPLFLTPFVALCDPHWAWLRWTTAAVSLLTVYGWWRLLEGWLSADERRWVVLLYALHPLFIMCSGMVMADPFLACLFVFALLGLRLVLEGAKGAWACALLCSMAAWAVWTKPIGVLLAVALTAALVSARAWKALRWTAVFVWLPWAAAGLAAALRNKTPTDYLHYMVQGLASLSHQSLWERGYSSFHKFILSYGLACPWPRGPVLDLFGAALIAAVLYLCVKGLQSLLSKPAPERFVALAAWILLLGQGLVMSLWTVYSLRYALPMLALGLWFLVAGLQAVGRSCPLVTRGLLAGLALGFLTQTAKLAVETNSPLRPVETRLYFQTLDWIRRETPPDSRFIGNGPLIDLYTGRSGYSLSTAPNVDVFYSDLSSYRITHALVNNVPVLSTQGPYRTNQAWQKTMERGWIRQHPGRFKKLYSNPVEKTAVYRVELPANWDKAVALCEQAQRDIRNADWKAAEANLRRSLAETPDFPSALMMLGSIEFIQRKDAAAAERLLRRVLSLEPNYRRATQLLAGILERQGRRPEAAKVRAAGQAAQEATPFEVVP